MNRIILIDLFSGIGGFRHAAELAARDAEIPFRCVAQSDNDWVANRCYEMFYEINGEVRMGDIVDFTGNEYLVEALPKFNLLTGGFPCQPFSMMGAKKGFEDERGGLFFDILKIVDVANPEAILLENVKNISTHDNGETLRRICRLLREHGYEFVDYDVFNTAEFGLPQTRNRVYILALRTKPDEFHFNAEAVKACYNSLVQKSVPEYDSVLDILETEVDERYYLSDKIKPTILAHGGGNFVSKSEINKIIARPLVATMVKMHRACQDNYYSDTFVQSRGTENDANEPLEVLRTRRIRKLTPREAYMLQGFPEAFVETAAKNGISNTQIYKQAGNAVSVNVVYAIIRYLLTASERPI